VDGSGTGAKLSPFRAPEARAHAIRREALRIAAPGSIEGWSQRALPLWQRKEIQALLRQPIARDTLIRVRKLPASEVGVRIETNQDLQTAITRLASRTPETLATFIASLAFDIGPIGEQVRTFIVGDNLSETTASLKERIEALRGSRRSHSRDRGDEQMGERLGYILDSIEALVLPVSSATAFELLVLS